MKVLKFGGSSVADSKNINLVIDILLKKAEDDRLAVVVSAFGGVTDLLVMASKRASLGKEDFRESILEIEKRHLNVVQELIPINEQSALLSHVKRMMNDLETLLEGCFILGEMSLRTSDTVLCYGELLSSFIISSALKYKFKESTLKDSRELIKTDFSYGMAVVNFEITDKLILEYFSKKETTKIVVLPGFIASTIEGNNTTLGRGGSDYTAAIIAAALNASILEIWTDVDGMFTANPKIAKQARSIPTLSYMEAMELSHFGAKVLFPPTIQPTLKKNIPIIIKNTFNPEAKGTLISNNNIQKNTVIGISHIDSIALLTLEGSGMVGVAGISKRLFRVLSDERINVIFITQASSEHSICVGILETDSKKCEIAVNNEFEFEISQNKINPCVMEVDLSIIALVGDMMKNHQGLSGKMFSTLGRNNVNIRAIAQGSTERNISVVINSNDVAKAINTLHEAFFEDAGKQLNLFVAGVGNVGKRFIEQINSQKEYLKQNHRINLRIIALSNSKKMVFDADGLDLNNWQAILEKGDNCNHNDFIDTVKKLNYRNSIFVDITASEDISNLYERFLRQNVAVVTCNKIACSSDFDNYINLKRLSRKYNAPFLFETNVGAGLPIIDTLKNLIASGDVVNKIQAVLSGSLNYIFNNFNLENTFEAVVIKAGEEGFTEPDPKIDLSGIDVARKLLILIRESGYKMNIEDIENISFIPDVCLKTNTKDDFYKSLNQEAKHFLDLYKEAVQRESRLKYVAQFENGKASVGLQFITKEHPFYNLEGKDNIVLFFTNRYNTQPLLIKGAGAGADVTASGIFADVIRVGNI